MSYKTCRHCKFWITEKDVKKVDWIAKTLSCGSTVWHKVFTCTDC